MSNELQLTLPRNWDPARTPDLLALIERTAGPSPQTEDIHALHRLLDQNPELCQQAGDLAALARQTITAHIVAHPLVHQAVQRTTAQLRQSLALPTDTGVHTLLIEECVTAHLHHTFLEHQYHRALDKPMPADERTHWERHLTLSQHRFLHALETLTRLRRLALPPMQINIGNTQTNIAALSTETPPP